MDEIKNKVLSFIDAFYQAEQGNRLTPFNTQGLRIAVEQAFNQNVEQPKIDKNEKKKKGD